ncbi:hypothetical protein U1Q18_046644 [Sarracenia purpurea var. burkii]
MGVSLLLRRGCGGPVAGDNTVGYIAVFPFRLFGIALPFRFRCGDALSLQLHMFRLAYAPSFAPLQTSPEAISVPLFFFNVVGCLGAEALALVSQLECAFIIFFIS